ncbi:hypothetical protein M8494_35575 [Serratia ureilytica]
MPAQYFLPGKAIVQLEDGIQIGAGDTTARIPQESGGTKDITGGLPRVADLFETSSEEPAILAKSAGLSRSVKRPKANVRLVISPLDAATLTKEMIPEMASTNVFEGSGGTWRRRIRRPRVSHDILRLRGVHAVYPLHPTKCRKFTVCKALRLTISTSKLSFVQMLRKGTIVSAGGSSSWRGEQAEVSRVKIAATVSWKLKVRSRQPSRAICWVSPRLPWRPSPSSPPHRSREATRVLTKLP